jgi:hypothetical protein
MHSFADTIYRSTSLTLAALRDAADGTAGELQTSAATPFVKTLQSIQLQKAIIAVGMFSMFDARLQDGLSCEDGFREAGKVLRAAGYDALAKTFDEFQLAVNVLKHGRGRSYEALVTRAADLPFRIRLPTEAFFAEGDVSEISTLVRVDDKFVLDCVDLIRRVSEAVQALRPKAIL